MDHGKPMPKLTIRVDFDSGRSIGPGKIRLLEAIARTGSIRRAADAVGMSFRQAWLLLRAIEGTFDEPVVRTSKGGPNGGGSTLTDFGQLVLASYRRLEGITERATEVEMAPLVAHVRSAPGDGGLSRRGRYGRKSLKL